MHITVILCLPLHCLLESNDLFLEFQSFIDGKKICTRTIYTDNLLHTKLGDVYYEIYDILDLS